MPIESIEIPKAPRGWQPSADQQRQVAGDPRLRRLGRDELYAYFNKPKSKPRQQPPQQQRGGGRRSTG